MDELVKKFVETVLYWWNNNRRDFPWRHTSDPYIILVTEILLRKTTANQVNTIHNAFFMKYPTLKDSSNCR